MVGIVGIIALLTVLALSLVVTRIATVALAATGLSREAAQLQARSAFTGTGFTTAEAEKVVDLPSGGGSSRCSCWSAAPGSFRF